MERFVPYSGLIENQFYKAIFYWKTIFILATGQSPGLPENLAVAYNPEMCLLELPMILRRRRSMSILRTRDLKKYYGSGDTLVKALDGVNPTPVTVGEAESRVIDELGDVLTCMACMTKPEDVHDVPAGASENVKAKAARWRRRLEERGRDGDGEKPVV